MFAAGECRASESTRRRRARSPPGGVTVSPSLQRRVGAGTEPFTANAMLGQAGDVHRRLADRKVEVGPGERRPCNRRDPLRPGRRPPQPKSYGAADRKPFDEGAARDTTSSECILRCDFVRIHVSPDGTWAAAMPLRHCDFFKSTQSVDDGHGRRPSTAAARCARQRQEQRSVDGIRREERAGCCWRSTARWSGSRIQR